MAVIVSLMMLASMSMMFLVLFAVVVWYLSNNVTLKSSVTTTTKSLGGGVKRAPDPVNPGKSGVIMFAPYLMPGNNIASSYIDIGGKYITIAFINWNGKPFWDSGDPDRNWIAQIRAKGGDVILSTGGQAGNDGNSEPALQQGSAQEIYQRYKAMVDMYNAKYLDLDIEVGKESQTASYQKRNDALVMLQKEYPTLHISYTLPCDPSGIGGSLGMIKDAASKGVFIDCVRLMTFDYGPGSGNYVNDTISCITNAYNQCKNAGLKFNAMGAILMVPKDDNGRPMSIDEVRKVVQWMKGAGKSMVGYVGFWALNLDPGLSYSKAIISELG
jgi:hypothetical protein